MEKEWNMCAKAPEGAEQRLKKRHVLIATALSICGFILMNKQTKIKLKFSSG